MAETIAIRGGTASGASLQVDHAGETVNGSYTTPTVTQPTASSLRYLKSTAAATAFNGLAIGVFDGGSVMRGSRHCHPYMLADIVYPTANSSTQIISTDFRDNTMREGAYIGGVAEVYRVTNGVMSRVSANTITGGSWVSWHERWRGEATSASILIPSEAPDGRDYTVGVAAIEAGNLYGTMAVTSFTHASYAAAGGTATANGVVSAPSAGGSLAAPAGFTATPNATTPRLIDCSWSAVATAIGYAVFLIWNGDENDVADPPYFDCAGGANIGDLVVVRSAPITTPDTNTMVSARIARSTTGLNYITSSLLGVQGPSHQEGDKTITFHEFTGGDPAPAAAAGSWYARQNFNATGLGLAERRLVDYTWGGAPTQSNYHVPYAGETYKAQVYVRASQSIAAQLICDGGTTDNVTITTGWTLLEQEFTLASTPTSNLNWKVQMDQAALDAATPITIDIAAPRIWNTAAGAPGLWTPYETGKLPSNGPAYARTHDWIKGAPKLDTAEALTDMTSATRSGETLHTFFSKCLQIGADPHIQFEWTIGREAWLDLLAYICAPVASGHAMALKRQAQGRTAPWIDAFPRLKWEVGNEAWNTANGFWYVSTITDAGTSQTVTRGETYGHIAKYLTDACEASPYWNSKIKWVLGGWTTDIGNFTTDSATVFAKPHYHAIAAYNGSRGVMIDYVDSYAQSLNPVEGYLANDFAVTFQALDDVCTALGFTLGVDIIPDVYEAGPWTFQYLETRWNIELGQDVQVDEEAMVIEETRKAGRAIATGTIYTLCEVAAAGADVQHAFLFRSGDGFKTQAHEAQGGGTYPWFQLEVALHERIGQADVHRFTTIRDVPIDIWDGPGDHPDNAVKTVDGGNRTFAYGFKSLEHPGRWMLVIGNADASNTAEITLCTPFRSHTSAQVWANVGPIEQHNRYPVGQRLNPLYEDGGDPTKVTGYDYEADSTCVAIDIQPQAVTITDPSRITIDNTVGADATGLLPGNCLLIELEGVA